MKLLLDIQQHAMDTPGLAAFREETGDLSYKELWEHSDQVANFIMEEYNLPRQTPIIVYGHMEKELPVAFLGSVKAGYPYIPVDTSIPNERVHRILENSGAGLIINVSKGDIPFEHQDIPILTLDSINVNDQKVTDPNNWVQEDELFYIIYTSGSTGNPKGVQISASNLESFLDWMAEDFPLGQHKVFLNQAPFSFDLSVMDLYPAFQSGGTVFGLSKEIINKPKVLFNTFEESNIQVWTSTPSFIQICLMDPSFNSEKMPQLELFLFCGEVLPVSVANELRNRFPQAKIFNTYGPTEATVAVTSIEITDQVLSTYTALPVGYSKQDTQVIIMNDHGEVAADGEEGEIVIAGPSVSKGYLGAPHLTEKAFFSYNGTWAYRTGDVGSSQNGCIFYQGRLDFQIKMHGYRMELEEIEFNLTQCQYVQSAVILPYIKEGKIEYLIATIVPTEHSFEKEYELTSCIRKELSEKLPAYMIPRKFVYKDSLPITANGKMDRNRIKEEVFA